MTNEPTVLSQILCVIFCLIITGGFIFFLCLVNKGIDLLKGIPLGKPVIKMYKK